MGQIKPALRDLPSMDGWELPSRTDEQSPAHDEARDFRDFPLNQRILRAVLCDLEFELCTPIQSLALEPALAGRDIQGQAQTGTGKTAAFLICVLEALLQEQEGTRAANQPLALVLAPTRELAMQIDRDAEALGTYSGLRHLAVYGGISNYDAQRRAIAQGVDLVAATPGRLIDYLRQRMLDLSKVRIWVVDEADRMLDMGFIPDVKRICARLPAKENRQTMLFSATLPEAITRLAAQWLTDPVPLAACPEQIVAEGVEEVVYAVASGEKLAVLLWLLRNESCDRVLIFRNRRRDTEKLYADLTSHGVKCSILSGDVPQKKRQHVLERFRKGDLKVIVATDVAGRGIHVDGISHVVNFDLPFEAQDYVHRVGRTGRAGEQGRAVSFACDESAFVIPDIEAYIERDLPIVHPTDEMVVLPKPTHPRPTHRRRPAHPADRSRRSHHGSSRRPRGPRPRRR